MALLCASLAWLVLPLRSAESPLPRAPMPMVETDTANFRWLQKPVLESRLLDNMEQTNRWSHHGRGEMSLTTERAKDGRQSLRLLCPTKGDAQNRGGRPWGECALRRNFEGEDWSHFNRLSFWVYPHLPGFKVISMLVKLRNDGAVKVPDSYGREGLNYFLLKPDQWNHVVWEIPHLARDKVTAVEFVYRQQGHEPGATNVVCYDLDQFELQRVEADHFEGWAVAPGRLAYSHSGYSVGRSKTALASGLSAKEFKLIDDKTAQPVLTKPVQAQKTSVGDFQLLDFSDFNTPGTYRLEAGAVKTRPFRIGDDVWADSVAKTINFFYAERCGYAVPGIHDVCHQDWRAAHHGSNIVINGGWHDAGDLSQGLVNTAESAAAMLALADRISFVVPPSGGPGAWDRLKPELQTEASWGLDWLRKTRFGDGARVTWATMDFWTDGVLGNADDMTVQANNSPFDNFVAAVTEATAAQVFQAEVKRLIELGRKDPKANSIHPWAAGTVEASAREVLKVAREDWQFAVDKLPPTPNLELASYGALASLELFKATREPRYADKAVELADLLMRCQQREFTDWPVSLAGFFYSSPRRDRIQHFFHRGHEQAPIVALAGLCAARPDHADWMKWYSAVVLHSEYLKRLASFAEPYGMLCASVYALDESNDSRFKEQVLKGVKLSDKHYLRRFPVWFDFRGNSGTVLSQTKALSTAARLRNHAGLFDLVEKQLQWHVGRNPFCQSLLFGEGHDYAPQYTAMSGDMVGSLPVGVQTRANEDTPYWPAANCYNYKEVWVHPSARWLAVLTDLVPPPSQENRAALQLAVSHETAADGQINLRVTARGTGQHEVRVRTSNLQLEGQPQALFRLEAGQPSQLTWTARVVSAKEPWIAVFVPDSDTARCADATGGWK